MMDVAIGKGVGDVLFGITETQAIKTLGRPDKSHLTDMENKRLHFNTRKLVLSFEPENNNLLGWIEVHDASAVLFGKQVIGLRQKELLTFLKNHIGNSTEIDDYSSFVSVYYWDHSLELQFSFDQLTNINFGCLYGEDDKPIWPQSPSLA